MDLANEKFLTHTETAKLLRITPKSLRIYREKSYIPFMKIGGKYIYETDKVINSIQGKI